MKSLWSLLIVNFIIFGCSGLGINQNLPKRDMTVIGIFLKESQNQYYMIKKYSGSGKEFFNAADTVSIGGVFYQNIFIAKA